MTTGRQGRCYAQKRRASVKQRAFSRKRAIEEVVVDRDRIASGIEGNLLPTDQNREEVVELRADEFREFFRKEREIENEVVGVDRGGDGESQRDVIAAGAASAQVGSLSA